jgi:threonine dehydratase
LQIMPLSYVKKILQARVYDLAIETPLDLATRLSKRLGNTVYLKREDLQPVFSFKIRGAYNRIAQLTDAEKAAGVIAASAGNHAQGVAMSAAHVGIQALIVMPKTTPPIKVEAVRCRGAKVLLKGDSYDEAYEHATQLAKERGATFIHPFDDDLVIAGQGTVAMEIMRQINAGLDYIFVPVGGGGLIAGVSAYIKYVSPETRVIGVEPEDAPTLYAALEANRRVVLKEVGIFADGVAVAQIGKETFRVARECVDDVVLVTTDEICAAIKDVFDETRTVAEPAGALSIAGMKKYIVEHKLEGKSIVAIESGANINFDRLRHVAERAEIGEKKEALLAVEIPEKPGSFLAFCKDLGKRGITEFNYRYDDSRAAQIFCGVELREGEAELKAIIQSLREKGYKVVDLTDNEMAKLHVRYMVGGHAPQVRNEQVFRFTFPERPGALLTFLKGLSRGWNISLFHYRNHGAAYGRVLLGIQLSQAEKVSFKKFLNENNYAFNEETDNPAYRLFVGADHPIESE